MQGNLHSDETCPLTFPRLGFHDSSLKVLVAEPDGTEHDCN